jgi:broad-specificity NMP kinase
MFPHIQPQASDNSSPRHDCHFTQPVYICLNGYPGVGKLTIAKALRRLIPKSTIPPVHATAVVEAPVCPIYNDLCIFRGQRTPTLYILISNLDSDDARSYEHAALERGIPFVSVILTCSLEENTRRLASTDRCDKVTTKLTDCDELKRIREEKILHRFLDHSEMELDVTDLTSEDAAKRILEHVGRVTERWKEDEAALIYD